MAARLLAALGLRPRRALHLWTFGDSILDCARYNADGVHPGALLAADAARVVPTRLSARAQDGATVDDLPAQAAAVVVADPAVALLTIGGNDLLQGLVRDDDGRGADAFRAKLRAFLAALPIRPVLIGNVYDPTFGDDARAFLDVDPARARANLARVNAVLADEAAQVGALVDLHGRFLQGDPSWLTLTIEPSLRGAHEIAAAFSPHVLARADEVAR